MSLVGRLCSWQAASGPIEQRATVLQLEAVRRGIDTLKPGKRWLLLVGLDHG